MAGVNANELPAPGDLLIYDSGLQTRWGLMTQITLVPGEIVMITGERRHYSGAIYFLQAETEAGDLIDISSDLIDSDGRLHFHLDA